jgi:hypothetical protein
LKTKKRAANVPARFIKMPPNWGPGARAGRKRYLRCFVLTLFFCFFRTPEENAKRTFEKNERRRKHDEQLLQEKKEKKQPQEGEEKDVPKAKREKKE